MNRGNKRKTFQKGHYKTHPSLSGRVHLQGLRQAGGACGGLGAEGRRVGDHPPLQAERRTVLQ